MTRKIALFGGTFDPIHRGHTIVAASAAEQIRAEKVIFIPASRSPHKQLLPLANAEARIEMITLAIAANSNFAVSNCELKRPQPSYTLDTVKSFQTQYGSDVELYFLVGADAVKDLAAWYKIGELIDLCNVAVMHRAGVRPPDFTEFSNVLGTKRAKKLQQDMISTPLISINGSEIRRKVALGEDISDMVAPRVLAYIEKNRLYR